MQSGSTVFQRRENGKLDKRRRIEDAAREVFKEFGYQRASMREIARRAGVATGTLFLYSPDKRNLLMWIVNDDLDALTEAKFAAIAAGRAPDDLLEQLIYAFEDRYRYAGEHPDLVLHALQENVLKPKEPALEADLERRRQRFVLKDHVCEMVRGHQLRGRVRAGENPEMIAQLLLAIYHAAVRAWLRDTDGNIAQGVAELRELLRLALEGCSGTIVRSAAETLN
jgi:AcrR family transcriptional regulator